MNTLSIATHSRQKSAVNKKLRRKRIEKNLTQQQMAERIGYKSTSGYNMIETGKKKPPLRVAMKIAEILGCERSDIFDLNLAEKVKSDGTTTATNGLHPLAK